MWLHASMSNNNPEYIAAYFVECVRKIGGGLPNKIIIVSQCLFACELLLCYCTGCPKILRTDPGTENSLVAVIQPALRHTGSDNFAGSNSHRYGKSPSNQVCVVAMDHVLFYLTHAGSRGMAAKATAALAAIRITLEPVCVK